MLDTSIFLNSFNLAIAAPHQSTLEIILGSSISIAIFILALLGLSAFLMKSKKEHIRVFGFSIEMFLVTIVTYVNLLSIASALEYNSRSYPTSVMGLVLAFVVFLVCTYIYEMIKYVKKTKEKQDTNELFRVCRFIAYFIIFFTFGLYIFV